MNRTKTAVLMLLAAAFAIAAGPASTRVNLLSAYNQEVNARLRYEAFARRADTEGYPGVAGLFRAVAFSEGIHGANHARALEALGSRAVESIIVYEVKDTTSNLNEAIRLEKKEYSVMYPGYLKLAGGDSEDAAVKSFKGAMASEAGHSRLFAMILQNAADWKTGLAIFVCKTCGFTTDDRAVKKCPFCGHPSEEFSAL